ncbi:hypothetical protein HPB48_017981 [Haemaphysalis longicornis]|uniref:HAT C-terminal dimerisation domain-containing protein n=1 Tax=Haemaphysalis longicornis TaxID=44386 RepID=A0A9J6FJ17_HAELO|nr:hypothetical protein HPB48_017981 [Haemaphysalis longicornis]
MSRMTNVTLLKRQSNTLLTYFSKKTLKTESTDLASASECEASIFEDSAAEDGKVHPVEPPRSRRRPARYENGSASDAPVEASAYFRRIFFSIIDAAVAGIEKRFNPDSQGIVTYRALELVLLNRSSEADLDVIRRYKSIDIGKVVSRVRLLHEEHCNLKSVDDVAAVLRNMHTSTRQYFKEVESFLRIILVMPVSSCEAERSFSALRRLKTWLRSTMGEERLNCMALHTFIKTL